jgi:hypothetical protein
MSEEFDIGLPQPPSFMVVDSSILQDKEESDLIREDIRFNRIIFEFPDKMNNIDMFKRCRMLFAADDFEMCYTTVMEMFEGKTVKVRLRNYDNKTVSDFCAFIITDKDMNLGDLEELRDYPYIVNWLIECVVGLEEKKYPLPSLTDEADGVMAEEITQKNTTSKKKRKW